MLPSYQFKVIFSVTLVIVQCSVYVRASPQNRFVRDLPRIEDNADDNYHTVDLTNDQPENEPSANSVDELVNFSKGFLVAENTPVWIAHRDSPDFEVKYVKQEENRVKKAFDNWKSHPKSAEHSSEARKNVVDKLKGMFSSVSEKLLPRHQSQSAPERSGPVHLTKQARNDSASVHYLSLLIVMDYEGDWPADKEKEEKLIDKKIVYASTFWYDVLVHLPYFLDHEVRLTISGFVIGKNREATPYIIGNVKWDGLHMKEAHKSMLQYWEDMAENCKEFPLDGYHIVATMTSNEAPAIGYAHAKSSPTLPCELAKGKEISGLVFSDNLAYSGLPIAVREIAHMLGAVKHDKRSKDCLTQPGDVMIRGSHLVGRNWSPCTLNEISAQLKALGSCLDKPREFGPSGNPIEPILPGNLMPISEQCKERNLKDGTSCTKQSSCDHLYCKNLLMLNRCVDIGPALDGTMFNNNTEMCLNGIAVAA